MYDKIQYKKKKKRELTFLCCFVEYKVPQHPTCLECSSPQPSFLPTLSSEYQDLLSSFQKKMLSLNSVILFSVIFNALLKIFQLCFVCF